MMTDGDLGEAIQSRMKELRSSGRRDVAQLHRQAGRVADWREHVRSQPVLSATMASIVGYSVVRTLCASSSVAHADPTPAMNDQIKKPSFVSAFASAAGGMVISTSVRLLSDYLKKQIGVHFDATAKDEPKERHSDNDRPLVR